MQPSFLDNLLWFADPTLRVIIILVLFRRNLIGSFPSFTAYNFFWVAAFPVHYFLHRLKFYQAYGVVYWVCSAISGVISFVVISELLIGKIRAIKSGFLRVLP